MSKLVEGLFYSKSHEWVKPLEDDTVLIGITDFAQSELGDVVFVDLPEAGDTISQEDEFGAVESVKAASDLIAPVTGEIIEVNEALVGEPELLNQDPYQNWLLKVKLENPDELGSLLSSAEYEEFIK
ncbi:MAG: glycine cleavage system protein GcvH [Candidatus Izemoplasmatales bacterium]|jgi:glycine cleavage system H protein|nr:glycine cleavage system protein GcvH [Candidatus Izemoplasmatales bacterium]